MLQSPFICYMIGKNDFLFLTFWVLSFFPQIGYKEKSKHFTSYSTFKKIYVLLLYLMQYALAKVTNHNILKLIFIKINSFEYITHKF